MSSDNIMEKSNMRIYWQDSKIKRADEDLYFVSEPVEAVELNHGAIYDVVPQVQIQEKWSWIGSSLVLENMPVNLQINVNGDDTLAYTSKFDGIGTVTVNYFPDEDRIYFAVEKADAAADFDKGLHELFTFSIQLIGARLFIEIRERNQ